MTEATPAARPARMRLRGLHVHAIAFVPEGANLLRWAEVRKEFQMAGDAAAGGSPTAKMLVLPRSAQESLAAGLTQAIEAMMAVLDLVKSAQVTEDETVAVPPEVGEQIESIGMMVAALGGQYMAPAPMGAPGAAPAAPPDMEAATPEQLALAKALGMQHAALLLGGARHVMKAKPTMPFDKALQLQHHLQLQLANLAAGLVPLLNGENGDALAAALSAQAATAKAAPAKEQATHDASFKALEAKLAELKGTVDRVAKSRTPSNGAPAEAAPAAPTEPAIPYGQNLSEIVKARVAKQARS